MMDPGVDQMYPQSRASLPLGSWEKIIPIRGRLLPIGAAAKRALRAREPHAERAKVSGPGGVIPTRGGKLVGGMIRGILGIPGSRIRTIAVVAVAARMTLPSGMVKRFR